MKNRGVEIYMNPLEEMNNHDIHSLLELQGIHEQAIRHTLMEIHKVMKNLITGIRINHLLRTAYLVSQNIKRGKSIVQSIRDICIDTYVHFLNGNLKQSTLFEIDRILEEYPRTSNNFWSPNLQTIDILQSSNLCYIKQQFNILKQHENLHNTTLEDLLLCYFGRSSSSDIDIRSQWLSIHLNIDSEAIKRFIQQPPNLEFDMLNFATKSVDDIDRKDLPYDFRYLPSYYFKNKFYIFEMIPLAENKIHLMLDHALNQALDKNFASIKLNKKGLFLYILI